MCSITEIEYGQFKMEKFDFIVGKYATYNHYYKIALANPYKVTIGLQSAFVGVFPQVKMFEDKILLGAGESLYVCNLSGNVLKQYAIGSAFYQFVVCNGLILVIGELDVVLLDGLCNTLWSKAFGKIIDFENVNSDVIELVDCNCNHIFLNLNTGEEINSFGK